MKKKEAEIIRDQVGENKNMYEIYSYKDCLINKFSPLMIFKNYNEIARCIEYALKNNDDMKMKKDDLQLWKLGEYNIDTGEIVPEQKMLGFLSTIRRTDI